MKLPADSGRGGHSQILHLKQHVDEWSELDAFTVSQAQHLVVIQHSVHVFNPQSVHWSIAYDPLMVISFVLERRTQNINSARGNNC